MSEGNNACCGPLKPKLVYACSGASDVGGIADLAARRLAQQKIAVMSCTAGVGGHVPEMVQMTRMATRVLAIDGCQRDCARRCLEEAGVEGFDHLNLERDLGMKKGHTPVTETSIQDVADRVCTKLKKTEEE